MTQHQYQLQDGLLMVSAFLRQARREAEQLACRHPLDPATPDGREMRRLTGCLSEAADVAQRFRQAVQQAQDPP